MKSANRKSESSIPIIFDLEINGVLVTLSPNEKRIKDCVNQIDDQMQKRGLGNDEVHTYRKPGKR